MNIDKRGLLIQAAIDLFAQKGFTGTSVRDIGKAARVNTSLVYYYFKDKEEILYSIIERSTRDLIAVLREIQSKEHDPLEGLRKMIIRHVVYSRESWKVTKLITVDSYQLHGQYKNQCIRMQREIYDMYMRQLQQLNESRVLQEVNLTVLNFTIFGMINWFYRWYKSGKSLNEEDVANQMIKTLFFGILRTNHSLNEYRDA
jgi:AcrR family transcriptional regulator